MTAIPEGYAPHDRKSPVTDAWEPLYSRRTQGAVQIAFVLAACHCNGRGMLHGGVIAALADNAMGLSLREGMIANGGAAPQGLVTTSLSVDYLGAAAIGQWIEVAPRVVWIGGSSGVVDALVTADGNPIARANSAFRIKR